MTRTENQQRHHFTGRAAQAAAILASRSSLVEILAEHGGMEIHTNGTVSYWIDANAIPIMSSGECLLWALMAGLSTQGGNVPLLQVADRVDEKNAAAAADAIAALFGQVVAA